MMQIPPTPYNEAARLQALQSFNILDTPPEERFDRITRLAQQVFQVPIALVSLIDAERQWFKSRQGLGACETPRSISFCGHAILTPNLFVVPDALHDLRFRDNPLVTGDPLIRFYAGFPLTVLGDKRLGTLCIIDRVPRLWSPEDQRLMSDLGQMAQQELATGPVSILEELKERNAEMELLSSLSNFLQASLDLQEAFAVMANLIEPLFPGCSGGIFTICASRNRLEAGTLWGPHQCSLPEFMPHDCWSLRRGRPHSIDQPRLGLRCNHVLPDSALAATFCIPMIAQGETLGLFFLGTHHPEALSEVKQRLACTVAEHIALAIANLHLRETLKHQSIRDSLTGLFNRHYLEENLQQEIARAQHNQSEVGVIMIDMDRFKQVNDTYGREAGDYILHIVGKLVRDSSRQVETACRYGGEELVLLLPESSLQETIARAESLRQAIAQLQVTHNGALLQALSASFGVAVFPGHGITPAELLEVAESALYQAKRQGRNQVVPALVQ